GFNCTGTTKSPQQACQPISECKLDDGSRINTAAESTLERPIASNIFESLNDGLVSKPIAPSAPARWAAFALGIDTRKVRDILLGGFARSPHRGDPPAASRAYPANREDPVSGILLAPLRWR